MYLIYLPGFNCFLQFSAVCLQFSKKYATSETYFGFTNGWSNTYASYNSKELQPFEIANFSLSHPVVSKLYVLFRLKIPFSSNWRSFQSIAPKWRHFFPDCMQTYWERVTDHYKLHYPLKSTPIPFCISNVWILCVLFHLNFK